MDNIIIYKSVLDTLFTKYADYISDCEGNRRMVAEKLDGVNFSTEYVEGVLKELVSDGSIQATPSEQVLAQQRQEAEFERSKAERARRMAFADWKRKMRDPNLSREEGYRELHKLEELEAQAKSDEQKALEAMTPAELRAKLRAEDQAKGYVRPVRHGSEAEEIW